MTPVERLKIGAKIAELQAISVADDSTENRKARLGLIANMLMAYPMAGSTEEAGKARAMAYLAALDDVPAWAIAEAVRRWHRGDCGPDRNYRFAPAPAELRETTMSILQPAKQTIAHLNSVLGALTIEQAMNPKPIDRPVDKQGAIPMPRLRSV